MATRIGQYIADTRREMAHVTWPTRTQTIAYTLVVVLVSLGVAFYLSAFDAAFTNGLRIALDHAPRFTQSNPALDVQVATSTATTTAASSTPDFTLTPGLDTTTQ